MTQIKALSTFLQSDQIKQRFSEMLGSRTNSFLSTVMTTLNSNTDLSKSTPESVYQAALMAAALDLPINPNLGFAYLIPYKSKVGTPQEKVECQFQIGAKGFKQLAQRTGLYLLISDAIVYDGQLIGENPLTGFQFDWSKKSEKVIGYVSYFKLLNGFESTFYMSIEKMTAHAGRYSQTFKSKTQWVKESSKWTTDYDAMALKTVTKLNLSKNGPLSVDMQKAILSDQSVIKENDTYEYVDNTPLSIEELNQLEEDKRTLEFIEKAKTDEELETIEGFIDHHVESEISTAFKNKKKIINGTQE
jgi:recombination protein RecT